MPVQDGVFIPEPGINLFQGLQLRQNQRQFETNQARLRENDLATQTTAATRASAEQRQAKNKEMELRMNGLEFALTLSKNASPVVRQEIENDARNVLADMFNEPRLRTDTGTDIGTLVERNAAAVRAIRDQNLPPDQKSQKFEDLARSIKTNTPPTLAKPELDRISSLQQSLAAGQQTSVQDELGQTVFPGTPEFNRVLRDRVRRGEMTPDEVDRFQADQQIPLFAAQLDQEGIRGLAKDLLKRSPDTATVQAMKILRKGDAATTADKLELEEFQRRTGTRESLKSNEELRRIDAQAREVESRIAVNEADAERLSTLNQQNESLLSLIPQEKQKQLSLLDARIAQTKENTRELADLRGQRRTLIASEAAQVQATTSVLQARALKTRQEAIALRQELRNASDPTVRLAKQADLKRKELENQVIQSQLAYSKDLSAANLTKLRSQSKKLQAEIDRITTGTVDLKQQRQNLQVRKQNFNELTKTQTVLVQDPNNPDKTLKVTGRFDPATGNLVPVPVQLPGGGTAPAIGQPQPSVVTNVQLGQGERRDVVEGRALQDLISQIDPDNEDSLFDPDFVGKFDGTLGSLRLASGIVSQQEAQFVGAVNLLSANLRKALIGAAQTPQELKKLQGAFPETVQSEAQFRAAVNVIKRDLEVKERETFRIAQEQAVQRAAGKTIEDRFKELEDKGFSEQVIFTKLVLEGYQ